MRGNRYVTIEYDEASDIDVDRKLAAMELGEAMGGECIGSGGTRTVSDVSFVFAPDKADVAVAAFSAEGYRIVQNTEASDAR